MASDGMYHHLRAIKLLILLEKRDVNPNFNFTNQEAQIKEDITADETNRNKKFKLSENFLKASAALLVAGTLFLGITFVRILI
jgi:DNA polymerase sigma